MITVGQSLPAAPLTRISGDTQESVTANALFAGKKVVLFAVPGAFTPTCSAQHLPGYIRLADEIFACGVDMIACVAVNDAFVMGAWGKQQQADSIVMLADGGAAFTKALGLTMDSGDFGGIRSQRYAMIIDQGVVTHLAVEPPKTFADSRAEAILQQLRA